MCTLLEASWVFGLLASLSARCGFLPSSPNRDASCGKTFSEAASRALVYERGPLKTSGVPKFSSSTIQGS